MKALRTFTCCVAAITALVLTCSQAAADFATPFVETTPVGGTSKEYGYLVSLGPQGTRFLVVVTTDQMEHLVLQAVAEKGVVEDSVLGKRAVIQAQVLKRELDEGRGRVDVKLKITRVWSDAECPNNGPKGKTSAEQGPPPGKNACGKKIDEESFKRITLDVAADTDRVESSRSLGIRRGFGDGQPRPVAGRGSVARNPARDRTAKQTAAGATRAVAASYRFPTPEFSEGLAAVSGKGGLGYIDRTGRWVIPPKFSQAGKFVQGIARVRVGKGETYAIDRTGRRLTHAVLKRLEADLNPVEINGKYGYVDSSSGKMVIEAKYDEAHPFSEGLAYVAMRRQGCRYIDKSGRVAISPENSGRDFHEGLAVAAGKVATSGSDANKTKWGFIDHTGKFVIPPQFDEVYDFSQGLAKVHKEFKFGFIDCAGRVVIPLQFSNATVFSEGLAAAKPSKEKAQAAGIPLDPLGRVPWGYIDSTGKFVIPPQFSLAGVFSEGLAHVNAEGFWGFIDQTGKPVIDLAKLKSENGDN